MVINYYDDVLRFLEKYFNIEFKDNILKDKTILDNIGSFDFINIIINLENQYNIEYNDEMLNSGCYEDIDDFIRYTVSLIDKKEDKQEVLVLDELNCVIGKSEKLYVHKNNIKHLAFSIIIFNDADQILLQKRSKEKYHSGSLWSNTCCSHPITEDIEEEAKNRLLYEMGIEAELHKVFQFEYKAALDNNLYENELDIVFFGFSNDEPKINTKEVDDFKWVHINDIENVIKHFPEEYTYWFKNMLSKIIELKNGMNFNYGQS